MENEDTREVEVSPLEYVIQLGVHGNHILFDNDRIRETFAKREEDLADLGSELVAQVRGALGQVLNIPDVDGKKNFIAGLPPQIQHVLIFLYFQMVEKTMLLNQKQYH